MVPVERIELSLGCPNRILSPARLPVPPHRQQVYSIQNLTGIVIRITLRLFPAC